ncbi:MAG: cytochrome c biogenesis protein CcsA [Cyclobacteriaceae bacterium]
MREYIGEIGHLSVVLFFVFSLLSSAAYFVATKRGDVWKKFARFSFGVHALGVFGVVISLFIIIQNHFYEYHYAWSHSSNFLPSEYMISCFWEGQEGSFLLWSFWHVILGAFLLLKAKSWENHTMAIFMAVQAFLASMILGVVPFEAFKIGSSPFILMKEAMAHLPIYAQDPNFIPEDGTGLNPLLQNYWMVIHPPTLFLGFALTLIPFVYAMAGLWRNKLTEWITPSLPWILLGGGVLGLGIMMGAYWAYETLNFGGYWNWDPVENAVYVPWLILVASLHGITIYRRKQTAQKLSLILVMSTFLLILYSTFLTRSGILGNSSVHSFTDLGLSGQLLIYLLFFIFLAIGLLAYRWKEFPVSEEPKPNSLTFWVLMGIILLCLAAFQVIVATSFPVINTVFGTSLATPTNQIAFYSNFQLWPAMLIAILSGVIQYLWWKKQGKTALLVKWGMVVLGVTLISSLVIVLWFQADTEMMAEQLSGKQSLVDKKIFNYILTLFSHTALLALSIVSLIANGIVLITIAQSNWKLTGGALAHLGLAMMLIGMLFSGGYSKVISLNQSGKVYSKDLPQDINTENVLLWRGKSAKMRGYELTYKGPRIEVKGISRYVKPSEIRLGAEPHTAFAKKDLVADEQIYFATGDSLRIYPENTYYEIEYKKEGKKLFTLYPRAQVNPQMGLLASPDIKHGFTKDLYTHISTIPDPEDNLGWRDTVTVDVRVKETVYVNDYVSTIDSVMTVSTIANQPIKEGALGIAAFISHKLSDGPLTTRLEMLIEEGKGYSIPNYVDEIGVKLNLLNIDPQTGLFTLQYSTRQLDYIILKAEEKPLINVLWIGTILVVLGFMIAFFNKRALASQSV